MRRIVPPTTADFERTFHRDELRSGTGSAATALALILMTNAGTDALRASIVPTLRARRDGAGRVQ